MSSYRMKYKIGNTQYDIPVQDDLQDIDLTDKFDFDDDFTIVYPNNGTEQSPANVSTNSRYVVSNPFPGYLVHCVAELRYNNQWGVSAWTNLYHSTYSNISSGCVATQFDDDSIVVKTGTDGTITSNNSYTPFQSNGTYSTPLPCRVKVWKIGKLPTQSP